LQSERALGGGGAGTASWQAGRWVLRSQVLSIPPRSAPGDYQLHLAFRGSLKHKGGGFYLYEGRRRRPNPRVRDLLGAPTHPGGWDIADRLTLTFVNEAARCLDESVLRSPGEGDLGAVLGLGFPPFLGGPFRYADAQRQRVVAFLERLAAARGDQHAPVESLRSKRPYFSL